MKTRALLLALALLSSAGCAHVPAPIADFGRCLSRDAGALTQSLIPDVQTALASANYFPLLVGLAGKFGYSAIDCAVHEVLGKARARTLEAPSDPLSRMQADHADAWLTRK